MVGAQVGDYRVLELLGVGGMGEVYRGVHTSLGRVVALKILSPSADATASGQRFHNEARIHAAIRHPYIATLFEHVEWNGRSCLVMEYVDGNTLSTLLKSRGVLPQEQALKYIHDIALALGTVGHVTMLRRTKAGPFDLTSAISLDKLDELAKASALEDVLLPLRVALDDIPALSLTPDQAGALRQGRILAGIAADDGQYFAELDAVPVALVEVEDGDVRVVRGFNL